MTFQELITEIRKYQYLEDTGAIKVALASIVATRLKLGFPIWMIVIGASSGGKSQILRPLALTDAKFLHKVDDLTENTFLSGMKVGKDQPSPSLLHRIGPFGMIVISDFTVIFSKNKEARSAILSQIRMVYDGEFTKFLGTSGEPLTWKGSLGILAGSTPSIYSHFEEVSDMGERFIYYRMKDYNEENAVRLAMSRTLYGKKLDEILSKEYATYVKEVVTTWIAGQKEGMEGDGGGSVELPAAVIDRIIRISMFAEKVRTPISMDFQRKDITKKPVSAYATRVALQIEALAKGLCVMNGGVLAEGDMGVLDWCAYSLANEEKRGVLRILAGVGYGLGVSTQRVADILGLSTNITGYLLQNLSAVGILTRDGGQGSLQWKIRLEKDWQLVREIEGLTGVEVYGERELSSDEEKEEADRAAEHAWGALGGN